MYTYTATSAACTVSRFADNSRRHPPISIYQGNTLRLSWKKKRLSQCFIRQKSLEKAILAAKKGLQVSKTVMAHSAATV